MNAIRNSTGIPRAQIEKIIVDLRPEVREARQQQREEERSGLTTRALALRREGHTLKEIAASLQTDAFQVWSVLPPDERHRHRSYTEGERKAALERVAAGEALSEIAFDLEMPVSTLYAWSQTVLEHRVTRPLPSASEEVKQEARRLRAQGLTLAAVSKVVRYDPSTISTWMPSTYARPTYSAETRANILMRYRQGESLEAIEKETGIASSTIARWLRQSGSDEPRGPGRPSKAARTTRETTHIG